MARDLDETWVEYLSPKEVAELDELELQIIAFKEKLAELSAQRRVLYFKGFHKRRRLQEPTKTATVLKSNR